MPIVKHDRRSTAPKRIVQEYLDELFGAIEVGLIAFAMLLAYAVLWLVAAAAGTAPIWVPALIIILALRHG